MKSRVKSIVLGGLLAATAAFADTNASPTAVSVDFFAVHSANDLQRLAASSPWLQDIRQVDGAFDARRGAWVASADLPYGQGSLILSLRREQIAADLALTMVYEETTNGDFIVQLRDAQNQILAADLFSNIIVAGREAKTDTFILDLARYPTATQIVLRRLAGEIRIYGLIFSAVACEVPLTDCDAYELAIQLDQRISSNSPLVKAAAQIAQTQSERVDWTERIMQPPIDATAHNPYAKEALGDETYPAYVPASAALAGNLHLQFTATSLSAVIPMLRRLNAYHPQLSGDVVHTLSSADSLRPFLAGQTKLCMMSIPMTVADRERFFRARGYPVLELPAALDPILVVVHPDNPINELTIPQLDAMFGTELRAGAENPIRTWGDLGLKGAWADRSIVLWGGSPQTGTARIFQRLALQDGPFNPRLQTDPYTMYIGVVHHVADDPAAIGFLNAQNVFPGVKVVALAPQTGLSAYPPAPEHVYAGHYPLTRSLYLYLDAATPDQINPLVREFLNLFYSRSGQEFFALSHQAPLPAAQVRAIRARLGF